MWVSFPPSPPRYLYDDGVSAFPPPAETTRATRITPLWRGQPRGVLNRVYAPGNLQMILFRSHILYAQGKLKMTQLRSHIHPACAGDTARDTTPLTHPENKRAKQESRALPPPPKTSKPGRSTQQQTAILGTRKRHEISRKKKRQDTPY